MTLGVFSETGEASKVGGLKVSAINPIARLRIVRA
jgi:hypothetical protein